MEYRYTPNRVCLIDANNQILAETTYPDVDEHTVNINHTWVDSSPQFCSNICSLIT